MTVAESTPEIASEMPTETNNSRSFENMADAELVATLGDIDPLAPNLSDLLVEMWKRGLREAESYGLNLMAEDLDGNLNRHPDERLYDVLEIMCGCFEGTLDAGDLLILASWGQRIFDVLMTIAIRTNPRIGYEVLDLAVKESDGDRINTALRSIISCVPTGEAELQSCLTYWVEKREAMPNTRVALFRRLAELPWSEELEDFFVRCQVDDDKNDAAISEAIDQALRQPH